MSKKRILLVSSLIILVLAVAAFFIFSMTNESPSPSIVPVADQSKNDAMPEADKDVAQEVLEPLPADNQQAIESEINNIDQEINSALDTQIDDLSGIEESL